MEVLFQAGWLSTSRYQTLLNYFMVQLPSLAGVLPDAQEAFRFTLINMVRHYLAIHADPPDPNFQQLSPLGPREVIDGKSSEPVTNAVAELGTATSTQAALLESFLRSLERYQ